MSGGILFFFSGTFFVYFAYHLIVSLGRKPDFSICGFSIYNLGLTAKIVIKDILPLYLPENLNIILYETGTCFSISIIVLGIILFTYEGFNLSGKIISKIFIVIYIFSVISIPFSALVSYITGINIIFSVYFFITFTLSTAYISFIIFRFIKDRLVVEKDKLIIIINTTVLMPVFIFYSILTLLTDRSLSVSYYSIIFISSFAYAAAITIRFNREHSDLIAINELLSDKKDNPVNEEALIDDLNFRFHFTDKEIETVKLLYRGFTNKRICTELNIKSESTVKSRVNAVFKKCSVSNRAEFFKMINILELNNKNRIII